MNKPFDPWTADQDEALAETEAAIDRGENPFAELSPYRRWMAATEAQDLRGAIESRDSVALMRAVKLCLVYHLLAPSWLLLAFCSPFESVEALRVESWDDAFGKPSKKEKKAWTRYEAVFGNTDPEVIKQVERDYSAWLAFSRGSPDIIPMILHHEVMTMLKKREGLQLTANAKRKGVFEEVADKFSIGWSTVRDYYYEGKKRKEAQDKIKQPLVKLAERKIREGKTWPTEAFRR